MQGRVGILCCQLPSLMTDVKVIYVMGEFGQCYLILNRVRLTDIMTVFLHFLLDFTFV
jgi:hypothetical protein